MAELPLIRRSLVEHEALIAEAGVPELLRRTGWIKLYRSDATLAQCACGISSAPNNMASRATSSTPRRYRGARAAPDRRLCRRDPFPEPGFVPDPGGLAKAYAALFGRKGGRFLVGDAQTLEQIRRPMAGRDPRRLGDARARSSWRWGRGPIWCSRPLGYSIPLNVKRGYHLHLAPRGNAVLQSSRARCRSGLSAGADEPRHSPHHRRRVCPPRCAADAGPGRAGAAAGACAVSAGRGDRRQALEGRAALSAGHAAGDREGAAPCRACGSISATSTTA